MLVETYTGTRYNFEKLKRHKMAILNFKTKGTEDINYNRITKDALRILPRELHPKARIKLARLGAVTSIQDLIEIRGNRFEKLSGDRKGQFSIRINDQYRVCFKWEKENAIDVEITDYHK
jgi:toxin HigB-1